MPLTKQQAEEIKKQLLKQIESWPPEQKEPAKKEILAMNEAQLEQFLAKNNLVKNIESGESGGGCIFCEIAKGAVPSFKIDENKDSIAILELNPMSKGHTIIIPKKHLEKEKLPNSAFSLAKKIAKKLKSKLKAGNAEISTSEIQGHSMINIVPLNRDEKPEKRQASKEELASLQKILATKPRKKIIKLEDGKEVKKKPRKKVEKKLPKAPVRMP
ncbi:MAG: HIT domain-containing protein [archaeon]